MMTIYSVRNDLGQEMWWSTNRKKAIAHAEMMTATWERNGRIRDQWGPYRAYKTSLIMSTVEG
jgi:hypothetical protein